MQMDFSIPTAGPGANFTGTPLSGSTPLNVTFTDTSTGSSITNRRWDFGDGNISNYAVSTNPFHRYMSAGTYTVNLTVTNASGSNSRVRSQYVTVTTAPVSPAANFTGTPLSGTSPFGMTFTDTSTGSSITNRRWDFGDGNISNYAVSTNPFHRYTSAGTYTVNLTVNGTAGTDSKVKFNYITVITVVNLTPKIGIYRNGAFYLRNSNTGGNADIFFGYGNLAGDIPVVGDWDGNGVDTIGVCRNGVFYLRNSNSNGIADLAFTYGQAGDVPVVGDWDGNGVDTIGVFRNGVFYLRNSNTGGNADVVFGYGNLAGDIPVVGDWDGNSVDTIGVFRNGVFYLRNNNSNGFADLAFTYGQAGDVPVIGDWNGNGIDTIGVFRNGVFYLRNSNSNGISDLAFTYGQAGDVPVVGDWNGT
jgi:PKD repeat protein